MVKLLKTLLAYQFKQSKPSQKNGGFTLIEVLVGLILALLVILPLLAFMVNMLSTDRQEQAKAASAQEIQTALNYISRDLEQSVYIYDSYGVKKLQDANTLPTPASSVPVLVFWKRQFLPGVISKQGGNDDAFVYALVAYYLKTPTQTECNQVNYPWSCTAQITRVLYRESVRDGNTIINAGDANFRNFGESMKANNLNLAYIEDIMNAWTSPGLTSKPQDVLIDYIDQTSLPATPAACPPIKRSKAPDSIDVTAYSNANWQQVPHPSLSTIKTYGFYACVDSEKTTAQVVIQGNALARLQKKQNPPSYSPNQAAYFPKATIQIRGRGLYSPSVTED
jgi:type II secretory pathway component PulJ